MAKITEITPATSLAATDEIVALQGNSGKRVPVQKIIDLNSSAALAAAQANINPTVLDGIFIMYHRKSDNFPLLSEVAAWKALEVSGEIADGVMVVQGANHLVISPTETSLYWSSQILWMIYTIINRLVRMVLK